MTLLKRSKLCLVEVMDLVNFNLFTVGHMRWGNLFVTCID